MICGQIRRLLEARLVAMMCSLAAGVVLGVGPVFAQAPPAAASRALDDADDPDGDDAAITREPVAPNRGTPAIPEKPAPQADARPPVLGALPNAVVDEGGVSWRMPPTPWRGQLTLSGSRSMPAEGDASTTLAQGLSATASSYVWQPWFLKLGGNFSISRSQDRSPSTRSSTEAWTLGGSGELLPATRYPFGVTVSRSRQSSDSRSGAGLAGHGESETTTLGLTQNYAPLNGAYGSTWLYNRMSSESMTVSGGVASPATRTMAQNLSGSVAVPIRSANPQSLTFNGNLSSTRNEQAGASSFVGMLSGAHSIYLEDYVMTLSSDGMMHVNDVKSESSSSRSSVAQAGTRMDWIPSDDYPLNLGGSARYFTTQAGQGGGETESSTANLSATARYPYNKQWTFSGLFNGIHHTSKAATSSSTRQTYSLSGSAGWVGEGFQRKWGDWDHSISYGSGSSVSYSYVSDSADVSDSSSTAAVNGNLGQTLTRAIPVEKEKPIRVSVSESYGVGASGRGQPPLHTLNHAANVGWETEPDENLRITYNASADDGRTFGQTKDQVYQRVSGMMGADAVMGAYSRAGARTNLSFSRQQAGGGGGRWFGSANAGANYNHLRFAGVSGLIYQARYDLNLRERLTNTSTGELTGDGFELQHVASQSWSWRMGLLGWKLDHSLTKTGNSGVSQGVYLSVTRDFSGVL